MRRALRFCWYRSRESVVTKTSKPTETPLSRFSNKVDMGTRVLRKSQAPLTRAGSRSTASQMDQSIMKTMLAPSRRDG